MKVLPLQGYRSLRALNVFSTLILGVKMLPEYMAMSYEDFLSRVQSLGPADQEKIIRQAVHFVKLEQEEVEAMCFFVHDGNNIPYGPANLRSLTPEKVVDIIVAVALEIAKIKVDFVSENEKKN